MGVLVICKNKEEPKFEPIRDIMGVLVTFENKEEPIKNEVARVVTRFSPL